MLYMYVYTYTLMIHYGMISYVGGTIGHEYLNRMKKNFTNFVKKEIKKLLQNKTVGLAHLSHGVF